MSKALTVDFSQPAATTNFLPCPPLISSYRSGWKNINLAHYQLPPWEIPEIASPQHTIILAVPRQPTDSELFSEGRRLELFQYNKTHQGFVSILPAELTAKASWNQQVEFTHCYLEPRFFAHAAHESIDPDRVEVMLTVQKPDPLISNNIFRSQEYPRIEFTIECNLDRKFREFLDDERSTTM